MGDHAEKPRVWFKALPSGQLYGGFISQYHIPSYGIFTLKNQNGEPIVCEHEIDAELRAARLLVEHINTIREKRKLKFWLSFISLKTAGLSIHLHRLNLLLASP